MRKLALFAIPAALLIAGTTLANTITSPGCGQITFAHVPSGWTALVEPGDVTYGPFATETVTVKVAPGAYTYTFHNAAGKAEHSGSFVVAACATPHPTPHATPPATAAASHEQYVAETRTDVLVVLGLLTVLGVGYLLMFRRVRP